MCRGCTPENFPAIRLVIPLFQYSLKGPNGDYEGIGDGVSMNRQNKMDDFVFFTVNHTNKINSN